MKIYLFYSAATGSNGKPYWFAFEHPAADIDALVGVFAEDGMIAVNKLTTIADNNGNRVIIKRERMAIAAASVSCINYPSMPYIEGE